MTFVEIKEPGTYRITAKCKRIKHCGVEKVTIKVRGPRVIPFFCPVCGVPVDSFKLEKC